MDASILAPAMCARPAEIPPSLLALAERMWAAPQPGELLRLDDTDDLLATLLGLDTAADAQHDELSRCEEPGCGAWFWAEDGASVSYESGRDLIMCDVHAVPDDPGARIYPGVGLEAVWRERDGDAARARIRETGSAW